MSPLSRRALLLALAGGSGTSLWPLRAHALPARPLVFPRDHGAHPQLRTEWWYITGHARAPQAAGDRLFGFQVTFFRTRVDATQSIASAFAARSASRSNHARPLGLRSSISVTGKVCVVRGTMLISSGAAGFLIVWL